MTIYSRVLYLVLCLGSLISNGAYAMFGDYCGSPTDYSLPSLGTRPHCIAPIAVYPTRSYGYLYGRTVSPTTDAAEKAGLAQPYKKIVTIKPN